MVSSRVKFCLPLLVTALLCGCARVTTIPNEPMGAAPNLQRVDAPAVIGTGPFHYRYALPGRDGRPQANAPFALSLRTGDLIFIKEGKKVWQGVTDGTGHTSVFALPFALAPGQVFLRPRFGSGPYGEQMLFSGPDGKPLGNVDYSLVICTDPPMGMTGHADAEGNLAYAASSQPARVVIKLLFAKFVIDNDEHAATAANNYDAADDWRDACRLENVERP